MTKVQIRQIERQAVRKYKDKLKSKVQAVTMFVVVETMFISGIIYNFI